MLRGIWSEFHGLGYRSLHTGRTGRSSNAYSHDKNHRWSIPFCIHFAAAVLLSSGIRVSPSVLYSFYARRPCAVS